MPRTERPGRAERTWVLNVCVLVGCVLLVVINALAMAEAHKSALTADASGELVHRHGTITVTNCEFPTVVTPP